MNAWQLFLCLKSSPYHPLIEEVLTIDTMDEKWMKLAIYLAKATIGQTSPNPNVGAVIVKNGELLGVGSHLHAGKKHAEVYALEQAAKQALGTTLYVTLEPCNHYGKTPPYTEKILSAGIQRVVIGSIDPDPRVAGSGIQRLQKHGIEVTTGVLQ